ncbi:hypothetical protein E1A91_D02G106100v1 [Gossypium mustelinum]|uniref:Uncharacterized protein n=1 Tax=Gossypium mustelinum TaxID=34275 RepID=A0A5D2VUD2_GOSMU|nr:hypothetical protein E1A91_D02G106100v1 [Gossypium mustelinum]
MLEMRRTEQTKISKTERWPARLRLPNSVTSRSMACTDERNRLNGSINGNVLGPLQDSMVDNRDITAVTPIESKAQRGLAAFDTESVSSGSTLGSSQSSSAKIDVKRGPQGIMVSTRLVRLASPSKLGSSSTRGMSPRLRNGLDDNLVTRLSILSFVGNDFKIGENKVLDANLLRLLHNWWLQWRFLNARVDATLSSQRSNAELLRQNLKLISILKGHMIFLDEWTILDHDYYSSLSGSTKALMASMVRLPVVYGARVDVPKL